MWLRTITEHQCFGSMSRPVNIHVVLEWASQGTAGPTANLEGAPPRGMLSMPVPAKNILRNVHYSFEQEVSVLVIMQEPCFHRSATTRPPYHAAIVWGICGSTALNPPCPPASKRNLNSFWRAIAGRSEPALGCEQSDERERKCEGTCPAMYTATRTAAENAAWLYRMYILPDVKTLLQPLLLLLHQRKQISADMRCNDLQMSTCFDEPLPCQLERHTGWCCSHSQISCNHQ